MLKLSNWYSSVVNRLSHNVSHLSLNIFQISIYGNEGKKLMPYLKRASITANTFEGIIQLSKQLSSIARDRYFTFSLYCYCSYDSNILVDCLSCISGSNRDDIATIGNVNKSQVIEELPKTFKYYKNK